MDERFASSQLQISLWKLANSTCCKISPQIVAQYYNNPYLCIVKIGNHSKMNRKIIAYKSYFNDYFKTLDQPTQDKFLYVLEILRTQDRIPTKFVKSIKKGLFELRIEFQGNLYRVFFIFDGNQIVVLFSAFQKKTQKTPAGEIERALKLMEEYYGSKND